MHETSPLNYKPVCKGSDERVDNQLCDRLGCEQQANSNVFVDYVLVSCFPGDALECMRCNLTAIGIIRGIDQALWMLEFEQEVRYDRNCAKHAICKGNWL